MRLAGERAERKLTEPTGIEVSLTNAGDVCSSPWKALSQDATCPCKTSSQQCLYQITKMATGSKELKNGISSSEWPNVLRRVLETKEP
jgi:hypothetical protein